MGTKNNPGAFDCHDKAEPDEPRFILLGRDKHAPTLLWLWASMRELDGEDPAVVKEARECAMDMLKWAAENNRTSVGIGQAAMAAVMELIRTVNSLMNELRDGKLPNNATTDDEMRRFLCETVFNFQKPAETPAAASETQQG